MLVNLLNKNSSLLSTLQAPLHTMPEKFENAILFISTVKPTGHTNPSRKRSFSKTLFNTEEYENGGFAF